MTRKDYVKIAEAINATRKAIDTEYRSGGATLAFLMGYLESVLKLDNPRFNREKFRKACGLES